MNTDDLIESLARGAGKVQALRPPLSRFLSWIMGALFCVGVGVAALGLRQDALRFLLDPWVALNLSATLALGLLSAASAFVLSVPGAGGLGHRLLPAVTFVAWVVAILIAIVRDDDPSFSASWSCPRDIVILGALPGALLFVMLRRAAVLQARVVGVLAITSVAAIGAASTSLVCSNDDPLHVLLWHYLPTAALGGSGAVLGRFLKRRIS